MRAFWTSCAASVYGSARASLTSASRLLTLPSAIGIPRTSVAVAPRRGRTQRWEEALVEHHRALAARHAFSPRVNSSGEEALRADRERGEERSSASWCRVETGSRGSRPPAPRPSPPKLDVPCARARAHARAARSESKKACSSFPSSSPHDRPEGPGDFIGSSKNLASFRSSTRP